MSRSRKDKKGGHVIPGYDKESPYIKWLFRRKRRRAAKIYVDDFENERKEPKPEKSSQGWFTY